MPRSTEVARRRLSLYLHGMTVLGLVTVGGAAAWTGTHPIPSGWHLAATGALVLGCSSVLLHLRVGHNSESFTWAEAALILSFVLVPPPWAVVLIALSSPLLNIAQRVEPRKVIFNTAQSATGVAVAAVLYRLVGGAPGDLIGMRGAVGLALAAMGFTVWTGLTVSAAVALSQQRTVRGVYAEGLRLRMLVAVGNISVGIGVVVLLRINAASLLVMPPLLALLFLGNRGYLRAREESHHWQQLEQAARDVIRLDESAVAEAALTRALDIFRADWVEIELSGEDQPMTYRLGEGPGPFTGFGGHPVSTEAGHMVVQQDGRFVSIATSPLLEPTGSIGWLRVGFLGKVRLSGRELQILTTYAHTVSTSVVNARLYAQMRAEAERHAYDASHDPLTGLANRTLLLQTARDAIVEAERTDRACGLLLLDLDHFKEINDTLGHSAGDTLLCDVGKRLLSAIRESGTVARLGGDEFAVLLPDLPSDLTAERVAERLLTMLSEPVPFEGLRLSVEASMGVACFPTDGRTVEELLQRADVAMYQSKSTRTGYRRYRVDEDASSLDRLALVAELRSALENDEFVLHYQPQVDMRTGEIVAVEVLTRWLHPRRGLVPPAEFVSVIEQSGLIRGFTLHVLDRAVAECAVWHAAGHAISVAVNLSARTLLDQNLPEDVSRTLVRHGLPAESLVLEITETTMMSELEVVESVMSRLRRLGVELSVDDFGTGYSSLSLLQRVAVNEVKVDRSFVRHMLESEGDAAIVRATIDLAHGLGVRVVAEGVEDAEVHASLSRLGCDRAQGFHLGRPMRASALRELLPPVLPRQRRAGLAVVRLD